MSESLADIIRAIRKQNKKKPIVSSSESNKIGTCPFCKASILQGNESEYTTRAGNSRLNITCMTCNRGFTKSTPKSLVDSYKSSTQSVEKETKKPSRAERLIKPKETKKRVKLDVGSLVRLLEAEEKVKDVAKPEVEVEPEVESEPESEPESESESADTDTD